MDHWLVDTNILLRLSEPATAAAAAAEQAVQLLLRAGHQAHAVPQVMGEFWCVATRPRSVNGLALTVAAVDHLCEEFEVAFGVLPDSADTYRCWRALVVRHAVQGVQVHDARLVAAMLAHGLTHLLTFNVPDFARYAGITAVHPKDVPTYV